MSDGMACDTKSGRRLEIPARFEISSDRCTDRILGADLIPYQLDMLTRDEEMAFEAHILECDFCFESLKSLDQATAELLTLVADSPGDIAN